ncbi:MAG: hypothetical protein ACM3JP_01815 [Betaproteobacteria bacterium]
MLDSIMISPIQGGRAWTYALRGGDAVLAVAARPYAQRAECDAVIAELFNRYEFDMTVRQRKDGRWGWELSKAGRPLLISPRSHGSPKSCGYAMRRVKRLIAELARTMAPPRRA